MRIVLDATFVRNHNVTGIERHIIESVNAMFKIKLSHEMTLLIHPNGKEKFINVPPEWNVKISPFKNRLLMDQLWIPHVIKTISPDWVHLNTMGIPIGLKYPFSMVVHDAVPFVFPDTISKGNKWYYRPILKSTVRNPCLGGILTVSKFSASELMNYLSVDHDLIKVVHSGVSDAFLREGALGNQVERLPSYFLIVGTLEPRKNVQLAIRAFSEIAGLTDINMIIVGRRGWGENMQIGDELKERIKVTGFVADSELASYYRNALALIFPSMYEGAGLPLIEALALGTPVIASDIPPFREIANDGCIFFRSNDHSDLARAMLQVTRDSELVKSRAMSGRERILREFTWDRNAEEVIYFIEEFYSAYQRRNLASVCCKT
ncbi:Glycosyltransferase involved in cell wall bisynthesis [Alicyclobacillus hesperidum]|uniref:Glycosyltransferase involved in cell wall bisynthesis n=1 Tax=Alicyclobacillus hesperidum TaxID=89784 RepID=A0A1H2WJY1_9BACL|nr:glycosyltransferase family 1 protein [Alicyclobacillus hesperidum]SDW80837.1 Glycosyltransferase involved in cell wall bisynthesis [Alicyclobacillus hesperidum]